MCRLARDLSAHPRISRALDFHQLWTRGDIVAIGIERPVEPVAPRRITDIGAVKHRWFALASGEMSEAQFTTFLSDTLNSASNARGCHRVRLNGLAPHGRAAHWWKASFIELKNLGVSNKSNGGVDAFYRSKHELIFGSECVSEGGAARRAPEG